MTRGHLIILALLTLVFAGSTMLVAGLRADRYDLAAHGRLYPELESQLNAVKRVRIASADREPVTLEARDGEWVVTDRAGYPADFDRLRELLLTLARTEIVEAKTRRPEHFERLGVQPIEEAGYGSYDIQLWNAEDEPLAHLVVGTTGATGGSFVRKADAKQSWLVSERLAPPLTAKAWLAGELLGFDPARIRRIAVEPAGNQDKGKGFTLVKAEPGATGFQLQPPPETGHTLAVQSMQRLAAALGDLRFKDVVLRKDAPETAGRARRVRIETFDGLAVIAQLREIGGQHYLTLEAVAAGSDDVAARRTPPGSKAEVLEERWQGWVYVLPDYQGEALALTRADLIEEAQGQGETGS